MKVSLEVSAASLEHFRTGMHASQSRVESRVKDAFEVISREMFLQVLNSTPRQTGALAKSGKLSRMDNGPVLQSIISFGDSSRNPIHGTPTAEYASVVHEVYNEKHPDSYKWLERTINTYGAEKLITGLSKAIRESLS